MPPFDREDALKKAEKALRQGRIDAAIEEYVRIVEKQPRDWNSANALGDLYIRANQIDKGIAQYTRIADHLDSEGFYPKAAALYKKILKIKPDHEHSLLQSGELAVKQKLLADAKSYFKTVADRRRARGDKKGAAEINIRIGLLDPDDLEARMGAARAAADMGDTPTALREYKEVALQYEKKGRIKEALAAFQLVQELNPQDEEISGRLFQNYLATGDVARARKLAKEADDFKQLAAAYERAGRPKDVLEALEAVAKLDPGDRQVRERLLQSYVAAGDIARARALASTADELKQLAAVLERAGRAQDVVAVLETVAKLDPTDAGVRDRLLQSYLAAGDVARAKALATTPEQLKQLAAILEHAGRQKDALDVLEAIAKLDPADVAIRDRLLKSYLASGDVKRARAMATTADQLRQLASVLESTGHLNDVLEVMEAIAKLDPTDLQVRARLAQAYAGKGDVERARAYLTPQTAGTNPALWLALAEADLGAGRIQEGRAAISQVLTLDPAQREAVVELGCRLAERSVEAGYPCIDAVADAALAQQDYPAAAAALHEFCTRVRHHVVALMRLVDVCVDGGLEATMYEAQAQLADAYLEVGRGLEARIISEDLVAREPWNRANIERFRRALVMLGEANPDAIIAERLSGESPFLATDKLDLNEGAAFEDTSAGDTAPFEIVVDLDAAAAPAAVDPTAAKARSLDHVFQEMRDEAGRSSAEEAAAEQYRLALTYRELGMVDEAIKTLEGAARSPRQRFDACSLLGRIYIEQGELAQAVDWLERAAEAPAPTPDASRALLYDLAESLEKIGEPARALAVFVELEADSGGYRDVPGRIERLSKVQAKG